MTADARTAKKAYSALATKLGVDAPPLAALATFTTKDARFAGEIEARESEAQEKRWFVTLQALRGRSARAPYFANGSAKDLRGVIDYYERRYSIGYTEQEKQDLVNLMSAI